MIDYNTLVETTELIRKNNSEWIYNDWRYETNSFPISPEMYESATWIDNGKKLTIGNDCYVFYSEVDYTYNKNDSAPYENLKEVMDIDSLAYAINVLEAADIVMVDSNFGSGISTSVDVNTYILHEISKEIKNMDASTKLSP